MVHQYWTGNRFEETLISGYQALSDFVRAVQSVALRKALGQSTALKGPVLLPGHFHTSLGCRLVTDDCLLGCKRRNSSTVLEFGVVECCV
jgi:hypothetical protein